MIDPILNSGGCPSSQRRLLANPKDEKEYRRRTRTNSHKHSCSDESETTLAHTAQFSSEVQHWSIHAWKGERTDAKTGREDRVVRAGQKRLMHSRHRSSSVVGSACQFQEPNATILVLCTYFVHWSNPVTYMLVSLITSLDFWIYLNYSAMFKLAWTQRSTPQINSTYRKTNYGPKSYRFEVIINAFDSQWVGGGH